MKFCNCRRILDIYSQGFLTCMEERFVYLDDPKSYASWGLGSWWVVGITVLGRFWVKDRTNCNGTSPVT